MAATETSCGPCAECCRLLAVAELAKPENHACRHARPGIMAGCCGIYEQRPAACVAFTCLWLASRGRGGPAERLAPALRPDKTHVVFYRNGSEADPRTMTAHVDPARPDSWLAEPVAGELRRLVAKGAIIIVEIGDRRVVLRRDRPPLFTSTAELAHLAAPAVRRPGASLH